MRIFKKSAFFTAPWVWGFTTVRVHVVHPKIGRASQSLHTCNNKRPTLNWLLLWSSPQKWHPRQMVQNPAACTCMCLQSSDTTHELSM